MVDALDVVELVDDGGQLLLVLDLQHHVHDGVAIGHGAGGQGVDLYLGGGQAKRAGAAVLRSTP